MFGLYPKYKEKGKETASKRRENQKGRETQAQSRVKEKIESEKRRENRKLW